MTDRPLQFVSWSEYKTLPVSAEDVETWQRDPELFALRHVSGRVRDVTVRTVDGIAEMEIECQPFALTTCYDCRAEGLDERATERLPDGTLLCAMHDHHRTMLARGRGLVFGDDTAYWRNWFGQMAPHSELAREVLDRGII